VMHRRRDRSGDPTLCPLISTPATPFFDFLTTFCRTSCLGLELTAMPADRVPTELHGSAGEGTNPKFEHADVTSRPLHFECFNHKYKKLYNPKNPKP
jgi:hypothetical protein